MCSDLLQEATRDATRVRRRKFDVMDTIEEVLGFIGPNVPAATKLSLIGSGPVYATANPQDVFRILFNLIHNAVGVARTVGTVRHIGLALEHTATTVIVRITDDGPGLPEDIKARLFQSGRSTTGGSGYGLSIARALAERNGAVLELSDTVRGTEFTLALRGVNRETRTTWAMSNAI